MAGLRCRLIGGTVLLLVICVPEIMTDCYGDLCFESDAPCWTTQAQISSEVMSHHFYLYSRAIAGQNQCKNSANEELFWDDSSSLNVFDNSLPKTVVVIHGWNSALQDDYIIGLCDAFLEMDDVNVIMVDWEEAANGDDLKFDESCRDGRQVALLLGILLKNLHAVKNLAYGDVHIVGHSLGAHVAGSAGEYLQGLIGRITGLDPARPFFSDYLDPEISNCHLDREDAQFVDVIHSDGLFHLFGLADAIGHQDFYPNRDCFSQPFCYTLGCSHMRAIDFFVSSIKHFIDSSEGCDFQTESCADSSTSCDPDGVDGPQCPVMGIEADGPMGKFCLSVPYCRKGFI